MFFDRYDAGKRLASQLNHYKNTDAVVYGLPRGGVLVGYEVARALHTPLDLIVALKIGHPINREFAICAITEDGERLCDDFGSYGVDESWLEEESDIKYFEAKRRIKVYRQDRETYSPKGKTAILVDDGIATGLTMKAAIHAIKKKNPAKIVVAVPVASQAIVKDLERLADEVVCIEDDMRYFDSVSSHYRHYPEVFDKEVITCLKQMQQFTKRKKQRSAVNA